MSSRNYMQRPGLGVSARKRLPTSSRPSTNVKPSAAILIRVSSVHAFFRGEFLGKTVGSADTKPSQGFSVKDS